MTLEKLVLVKYPIAEDEEVESFVKFLGEYGCYLLDGGKIVHSCFIDYEKDDYTWYIDHDEEINADIKSIRLAEGSKDYNDLAVLKKDDFIYFIIRVPVHPERDIEKDAEDKDFFWDYARKYIVNSYLLEDEKLVLPSLWSSKLMLVAYDLGEKILIQDMSIANMVFELVNLFGTTPKGRVIEVTQLNDGYYTFSISGPLKAHSCIFKTMTSEGNKEKYIKNCTFMHNNEMFFFVRAPEDLTLGDPEGKNTKFWKYVQNYIIYAWGDGKDEE